jgi:hypothetical protein
MADLNYSKYDVVVLMRAAGGPLSPTVQQLEAFDGNLFSASEPALSNIMQQESVPLNKSNRSTILLYARFMAGGTFAQRCVKACRYFKETDPL